MSPDSLNHLTRQCPNCRRQIVSAVGFPTAYSTCPHCWTRFKGNQRGASPAEDLASTNVLRATLGLPALTKLKTGFGE